MIGDEPVSDLRRSGATGLFGENRQPQGFLRLPLTERRNDSGYRCVWIKPNYEYRVFDVIVELLLANGGRARKGNGRNYKLGEPECDETTVVGTIAKKYAGKKNGESVFDPVFVFAAVLEWAGIAHNERGE